MPACQNKKKYINLICQENVVTCGKASDDHYIHLIRIINSDLNLEAEPGVSLRLIKMCVLLGGGVPTIKGKERVLPCLPLLPGRGGLDFQDFYTIKPFWG